MVVAQAGGMKATDLIKQQHREVDALFAKFEKAKDDGKPQIFEKIAATLVAHDAIEREIFYPACEAKLGSEDILQESLVEHGLVEFCIFRADKNRGKDMLEAYVKVLKEVVQHHVEEEEDELLPKIDKAMQSDELETLGAQMEDRFQEAIESDFRRPLRQNLQQVLAGRAKTSKRSPRAAKGSRSRPKARTARTTRGASKKTTGRGSRAKHA
jgi:hemerythrin superfamily protein